MKNLWGAEAVSGQQNDEIDVLKIRNSSLFEVPQIPRTRFSFSDWCPNSGAEVYQSEVHYGSPRGGVSEGPAEIFGTTDQPGMVPMALSQWHGHGWGTGGVRLRESKPLTIEELVENSQLLQLRCASELLGYSSSSVSWCR